MKFAIAILIMLIGFVLLGILFLFFFDKNSEEPKVKRRWSDPKNR